MLLFFVVALVGDQAVADRVVGLTESFLPDAAQSLLDGAITGRGGVGNAVLLGEGDPRPRTDGAKDRLDEANLRECAERLHSGRDRRQTLQHELAQARRQLHDDRATALPTGVAELRAQNRLLRRRLRWAEKSLPERLFLRSLGATPPDTAVEARHTSRRAAAAGGQSQ